MADELSGATPSPTTESPAAPAAVSAATPAAVNPSSEATSDGARSEPAGDSLWQRLFGNRGAQRSEAPAAQDATSETPEGGTAAKPGTPASATQPAPWQPPTFTSEAEYTDWLERQGQSYADRRDATRAQRDRSSRLAQLEQGIAQAHESGDVLLVDELTGQLTDLKAGVKREEDAGAQTAQLVGRVASHFDRTVIDPIFAELPDARRTEIATAALQNAQQQGLDGVAYRQLLAADGLKALKEHYLAEGERRARTSPAYRQQVRAELRGDGSLDEPPTLAGVGAAGEKPDMNAFIRRSVGRE